MSEKASYIEELTEKPELLKTHLKGIGVINQK
jgi:hypothetical protein